MLTGTVEGWGPIATVTGDRADIAEIRNFYDNDIIELDEADDRAEIVFGEWLTETLLHGFFCQEENEGAALLGGRRTCGKAGRSRSQRGREFIVMTRVLVAKEFGR